MRWFSLLPLLAVLLVGCQSQPKATHASAGKPNVIVALSDQKQVYECPNCGMDFDGPGKCTMCDVDLVKTEVAYICPADNKPVDRAGACPRCNVNAKIVKTAVAAETPTPGAAPSGGGAGSPAPGAAGSRTPNGS